MGPGAGAPGNPGQAIGAAIGPAMGGEAAGLEAQQQQLQTLMGQIRAVNTQLQQIGVSAPALGPLVQQAQQLLKQMVVMSAQAAQAQTASGMAVPGGAAGA
jgi:hypothetical protein